MTASTETPTRGLSDWPQHGLLKQTSRSSLSPAASRNLLLQGSPPSSPSSLAAGRWGGPAEQLRGPAATTPGSAGWGSRGICFTAPSGWSDDGEDDDDPAEENGLGEPAARKGR